MNKQTIKITKRDNFVWKIVTAQEAKDIMSSDAFALYVLYDDDSESLISDAEELDEHLENGVTIGIEVGFITSAEVKN